MADEVKPKRGRGRPKGQRIGKPKFHIDNIYITEGEKFDSPLTVRGTPRKRKKYPHRHANLNYFKGQLTKAEYANLKEAAIIKFLSFCPRYSTIYTNVAGERDDAIYIDIMVCQNDRIYRVTKLAAIILKKKMAKTHTRNQFDKITWRPEPHELGRTIRDNMKYTEMVVKRLSQVMFNCDDGYFWQDLSKIYMFDCAYRPKQKKHAIPQNKPEIVLDKVDESNVESTPRKSYRVR